MCILIVSPSGVTPHRTDLEVSCENNPDGFGYAIHTGRHLLRRRSMDSATAIARYLEDRKRFPDGPAMFHARIATSGVINNSTCHPFQLRQTAKVAVAHNGVLPIKADTGWRSDTRYLVEEVLTVESLADPTFLSGLKDWMGPHNKIAFLSADRRLAPYTIVNEEAGHWEDGSWWSNYSYTWARSYSLVNKSTVGKWSQTEALPDDEEDDSTDDYWDQCPFCYSDLGEVDWEEDRCQTCWTPLSDHVDSKWCFCPKCVTDAELVFEEWEKDQ